MKPVTSDSQTNDSYGAVLLINQSKRTSLDDVNNIDTHTQKSFAAINGILFKKIKTTC